jgi:diaminopimelate decarboxylase
MPSSSEDVFHIRKGRLHCEQVDLVRAAQRFRTPLYVYSATLLSERLKIFSGAFASLPHTVCYSVKANPNLSLLTMLARAGAGFDVVSGGELLRVGKASRSWTLSLGPRRSAGRKRTWRSA